LETLDLSLHVIRRYAWPLLLTFSLGAVPLMLLNHLLIGWILDVSQPAAYFYVEQGEAIVRYLWDMTLLVVIEAPLASVFTTKFLGDAVFVERPRLVTVVADVSRLAGRIGWCQLLVRGVLAAWLLVLTVERQSEFQVVQEFLLLGGLLGCVSLVRAVRPYVNEIVLLEQTPLFSRVGRGLTVAKRSQLLHTPSSGDLFTRWLGTAIISALLTGTVFGSFLFISGVFFNDWWPGPGMLLMVYPFSLWIVAGFVTVARFLGYLDGFGTKVGRSSCCCGRRRPDLRAGWHVSICRMDSSSFRVETTYKPEAQARATR
jgi:hypothetical protein